MSGLLVSTIIFNREKQIKNIIIAVHFPGFSQFLRKLQRKSKYYPAPSTDKILNAFREVAILKNRSRMFGRKVIFFKRIH